MAHARYDICSVGKNIKSVYQLQVMTAALPMKTKLQQNGQFLQFYSTLVLKVCVYLLF